MIPRLNEYVALETLLHFTSDLLYVLVVMAIIPAGMIIWLHSVIAFWRRRNFANGATVAWNTFAMTRNVISASRELPGAFSRLSKACFGGKGRNKGKSTLIMFGVFVVVMAILGGWMTASAIMKKADREYDLSTSLR